MDLDGTVLREDQTIHPDLAGSFSRARDAGIQLAICTGRAFQSTKRIASAIDFSGPLVCSNGAHVINDEEEVIGAEFLPGDVQEWILEYADENSIHVSCYGENGVSTLRESEWLTKYKTLVRGLDIPILGMEALKQKPLFKIVLICSAEVLPIHREKFAFLVAEQRAQLTESGPEYLEILPVQANKGNGLAKLAQYLRLDRSEIAAIGDYRNDLEMLSWVGTAGAVKNALPEVKSLAQFVVKSNEDGGVAEFIDRCILLNSNIVSES